MSMPVGLCAVRGAGLAAAAALPDPEAPAGGGPCSACRSCPDLGGCELSQGRGLGRGYSPGSAVCPRTPPWYKYSLTNQGLGLFGPCVANPWAPPQRCRASPGLPLTGSAVQRDEPRERAAPRGCPGVGQIPRARPDRAHPDTGFGVERRPPGHIPCPGFGV